MKSGDLLHTQMKTPKAILTMVKIKEITLKHISVCVPRDRILKNQFFLTISSDIIFCISYLFYKNGYLPKMIYNLLFFIACFNFVKWLLYHSVTITVSTPN